MKKVICSFGTIALIAGSVSDVKASRAFEKASTYGGVVRAPKRLIKSYDAGTGKVVTHDLESGLKWTEKTQEELREKKAMAARHTSPTPTSSRVLSSPVSTSQSSLSRTPSFGASNGQSGSGITPTNTTVSKKIAEGMVERNNNEEFLIVENPPVQAMPVDQFQLDDETRNKLEAIILPNEESTSINSYSSSSSSSSADGNAILVSEPSIFDAMAGVVADNILLERWNNLGVALEALGIENLSFAEVLKSLGVESEQLTNEVHDKMRLLNTVQNVDAVFNNSQIKSQIIDKLYSADSQGNLRNTLEQMEFDNVKRGLSSAIAFDTVARSVIQKVGSINDKSHIFVLLNALGSTDGSQLLPGVKGRDIEDLPVPESKKEAIVKLLLRLQEIR